MNALMERPGVLPLANKDRPSRAERPLKETFTSTGAKFFHHEEAMAGLRSGKARCVVTHLMPTDICQHTCAFCSVQTRDGNVLRLADMLSYVDTLVRYGLKAVILSGGGNPLLYRDPDSKAGIAELVFALAERGLDIGMITNGMKLREWPDDRTHGTDGTYEGQSRRSFATLPPEALDKLTWLRISMAGLDHDERRVDVPDVDSSKTTLGFSYVYHDLYDCPEEPNHGKVSTVSDLLRFAKIPLNPLHPLEAAPLDSYGPSPVRPGLRQIEFEVRRRMVSGEERLPWLEMQIAEYVRNHRPRYVRLLPNCFERDLIPARCELLEGVAGRINERSRQFWRYDKETNGTDGTYAPAFVQFKPPAAPNACFLGYIHPVLNSDGWVYPCDSNVLNAEVLGAGEHKFGQPWRLCRWDDVAELYEAPVRSLVDPKKLCPGCVFNSANTLLEGVVNGSIDFTPSGPTPEHVNFV